VLDAHHDDFAWLLAKSVEHPIGAATSGPDPRQVAAQGLADTAWLVHQGTGDEVNYCRLTANGSRAVTLNPPVGSCPSCSVPP